MSEKEITNNKKVLKIILITLLIVIVIAGASIGGYFGYQYYSEKKSTGAEWADTYYNYIVNEQSSERPIDEFNKISSMQDAEIGFIQTNEHSKPLMIATGKKDEDNISMNYAMIYEIDENNNVTGPTVFETSSNLDVEFLFDVQKKKYDYFLNALDENSSAYTSIDTIVKDQKKYTEIEKKVINGKSQDDLTTDDYEAISKEYEEYKENDTTRAEYTISKSEQTVSQNTLSGETISYDKSSEYVIDPGVEEETFSYSKDMKKSDIRNAIEAEVNDYKTIEETATEDVKTSVEQKTQEVETKKQQIETAKAEIKADEERKAAEEAARKAEEEAKKGLKVGSATVKYGTYKGIDAATGETLILKSDGTATIYGKSYKFTVGKYDFAQDISSVGSYKDAIILKNSDGTTFFAVYVGNDGTLYNEPNGYVYSGN